MLSFTEENYLKAIYHISESGANDVSTNALAEEMKTKAASVTDMLKKLSQKDLVEYKKYKGVKISKLGEAVALQVIRKHRLWEVFLVERLQFNWDEVHDIAEQLEHIKSPLLIKKLDAYLEHPKYDPHGDPIPDENGQFGPISRTPLAELQTNSTGKFVAVKDSSSPFLQYLDKVGLYIGATILVLEIIEFDGSREIEVDGQNKIFVSQQVANNLLIH